MPRYEFSEGTHNKFWEITLQGNDVITHYGRIGSEGQSTTKSFKTPEEAKSAYDKLIAEKTKKGYVAAGGSAAVPKTAAAEKASSKPDGADNASFVQRLDRWLKANRPKYYAKLEAGASEKDLADFEKQLGEKLPDTLRELLRWKSAGRLSSRLIDNWSLMSLESVVDAWSGLKELKDGGEFKERGKNWWNNGWVPFLENGGGDHLCIDLSGAVGDKGAVICFWHDDAKRPIEHDSIDALFESFLPWLEQGQWDLDANGFFNYGKGCSPSDAAKREEDEDEDEEEVAAPPPLQQSSDPKVKETLLLAIPNYDGHSGYEIDASADGAHVIYKKIDRKEGEVFYLDGKASPQFESVLGPWFDERSGTMVYKDGKNRKWRWHIGEQPVHDAYDQSHNPVFSPDGQHHCYAAKKGKKWMLVVDGVPRKETFDRVGGDPIWSPDGTKIAYSIETGGKAYVIDGDVRGPACESPRNLAYSPDGKQLAYSVGMPQYRFRVICGDFKSEILNLEAEPGFTPTGELWYAYSTGTYGIHYGKKTLQTKGSVWAAFFNADGTLAAHFEWANDRKSLFVRAGKPPVDIPSFSEAVFHAPDTFAIVCDKMSQQEAFTMRCRKVLMVNGHESGEYRSIRHVRFSSDGKRVTAIGIRDSEVWKIEIPV